MTKVALDGLFERTLGIGKINSAGGMHKLIADLEEFQIWRKNKESDTRATAEATILSGKGSARAGARPGEAGTSSDSASVASDAGRARPEGGPSRHTAEFVSPRHPDKLCDRLADAILDEFVKRDPSARVAVEVMAGHGLAVIGGEITSRAKVDIAGIAKRFLRREGWPGMKVLVNVAKQSPEIARGVDAGGAGDQGIMVGYACDETPDFYPLEYALARDLCKKIYKRWPYDGKTQVTVNGKRPTVVVASFQNAPRKVLEPFVRRAIKADTYLINPAGDWTLGGFDADSGLSGRKLVVDAYGPRVPIGGGSWAGKDMTKVDRSGALAARKIAVALLKKHKAHEVTVRLAYAIGIAEPVMAVAEIDGKHLAVSGYDLTPRRIKRLVAATS